MVRGDRFTRVPDEEGVYCAGGQEVLVGEHFGVMLPGGFLSEYLIASGQGAERSDQLTR
jgi:hypothetical protein